VPEAAIDEDRDLQARKGDIDRPSSLARDREGDTIAETERVELPAKAELRSGVTTLRPAHPPRHGV